MEQVTAVRTTPRAVSAAWFIGIGLVIYALLLAGSEWLVYRNGRMNPVYKADVAAGDFDWVILGASHAMPLDFGNFNKEMQRRTGKKILNLAGSGTGPLYARFAFEHFLTRHRTRNLLYVADGFAFRAPVWNEGRFTDADLMARTPFHVSLAGLLVRYVVMGGVDPRALADYVAGFSKLNNRGRFQLDVWEGEASFDRAFKLSPSAERKRVEYLYPPVADERAGSERYFDVLADLIGIAERNDVTVTIVKMPLPPRFKSLLPGEATFDAALVSLAGRQGVSLIDWSDAMPDPGFYADTDHLNRKGVMEFFGKRLQPILSGTPLPTPF
ncbi:MAG: hypothetical protein ABS35_19030 [Kaistia sp. SCN 65-12]|nr:MAG: hypothetical protein ABS35_19030 [Kaistia sp. SCN 65-12]